MHTTVGSSGLNITLRRLDFWANRTDTGGVQKYLKVPGYSPLTLLLLYPVLLFLIYGPTLGWRGWNAFALLLATGAVLLLLARWLAPWRKVRWLETVAVLGIALLVAYLAGPNKEADSDLYRHALLPILGFLMGFVSVVPPLLARFLVSTYRKRYFSRRPVLLRRALERGELFVHPSPPRIRLQRFMTSLLPTFFHHLLTLLLFPAIVILLVPHPWMWQAFLATFVLALVIYSLGGIDTRLNAMLELTGRAFLLGGQLLISLLIISLALGRLFNFSYVAIILNSASSRVIILYVAAAYTTMWLYESWIHFVLCERLLPLLMDHRNAPPTASRIPYLIDPESVATSVLPINRFVQIHGTRFLVLGRFVSNRTTGATAECFESYEKADLFDAAVKRAYRHCSPDQIERRFGLADLRQRILTYFAVLNVLLLLACWGTWVIVQRIDTIPEYQEQATNNVPTFDLRERLFEAGPEGKQPRRIILVAASGGGTRAALYTASVFHGLAKLNALEDVALFSGVSGGSASIAYLTLHRGDLVRQYDLNSWDRYADVMTEPFIEDVLRGAAELRIAHGSRLGILLKESFQRRMGADNVPEAERLLGRSDVGLIFNTTLAGISDKDKDRGWGPATPAGAGGRLLFTNVRPARAFPRKGYDVYTKEEYLTHRLIQDPTAELTTAAALSANFPPVFSNALVETTQEQCWVTDGGASDNRGVVSALYVLKDALQRERYERKGRADKSKPLPPEIHVILAEASGFTMDYTQDRGLGSTLGAAEKYASQLMVEVMNDIGEEYVQLDGQKKNLYLHFLPMPLVFRARGGVGTHWMLGSFVTLTESVPDPDKAATVTLRGETVKQLIMDLHRGENARRAAGKTDREKAALERVWKWIDQDPHQAAWERIRHALESR